MFNYDQADLAKLVATISSDRLSTYMQISNGDLLAAIKLHARNTALSEALYTPLQGVEVAIRNAIHDRMILSFGIAWFDSPRIQLQYTQARRIADAKASLLQEAKPLTPGRIVAGLSFGFWVGILGRKYETHLWRPVLRRAFPNVVSPFRRQDVHSALDRIRRLRNRVMHHEPILMRDLKGDHDLILSVIGWVCTETRDWIAHHSRFEDVFSN